MSKVQIDDYKCPLCKKYGYVELDTKTGVYTCLMCGKDNTIIKEKLDELEELLDDEKVDDEFRGLIEEISDTVFWKYVESWKDEQDLIDQMLEWDTETKAQGIKEIKELIEKEMNNENSTH
jgi:phosphoribosyl-ATP pyrophosphohydrolase